MKPNLFEQETTLTYPELCKALKEAPASNGTQRSRQFTKWERHYIITRKGAKYTIRQRTLQERVDFLADTEVKWHKLDLYSESFTCNLAKTLQSMIEEYKAGLRYGVEEPLEGVYVTYHTMQDLLWQSDTVGGQFHPAYYEVMRDGWGVSLEDMNPAFAPHHPALVYKFFHHTSVLAQGIVSGCIEKLQRHEAVIVEPCYQFTGKTSREKLYTNTAQTAQIMSFQDQALEEVNAASRFCVTLKERDTFFSRFSSLLHKAGYGQTVKKFYRFTFTDRMLAKFLRRSPHTSKVNEALVGKCREQVAKRMALEGASSPDIITFFGDVAFDSALQAMCMLMAAQWVKKWNKEVELFILEGLGFSS